MVYALEQVQSESGIKSVRLGLETGCGVGTEGFTWAPAGALHRQTDDLYVLRALLSH